MGFEPEGGNAPKPVSDFSVKRGGTSRPELHYTDGGIEKGNIKENLVRENRRKWGAKP